MKNILIVIAAFVFSFSNAQIDTLLINTQIRNTELKIKQLKSLEKSFEVIDVYRNLIQSYQGYLEKYQPEKLANYYQELSYYFSDVYNQKYEIEYTKKAISLMEKTNNYEWQNYLTAYNDWYYYVHNYGDPIESKKIYALFELVLQKLQKEKSIVSSQNLNYAKRIFYKMQILEDINANKLVEAKNKLQEFYERIKITKGNDKLDDIGYYMSCYDAFTYKYYENNDFTNAIFYLKKLQSQAIEFELPFFEMKANALLGSTYYYTRKFEKGQYHSNLALSNFNFPPNNSSKYSIEVIKALNLSGLQKHNEATAIVERIFSEIVEKFTNKKVTILTIDESQLIELNSHNFINIFATSSILFIQKFKYSYKIEDLKKAEKLALTASMLFQEFYKKDAYNSTLSRLQNKITETLLFICSQSKTTNQHKIELLNAIERNVSQHLFKEVQKKTLLANPELASFYHELEQAKNEKIYYSGLQIDERDSISKKVKRLDVRITNLTNTIKQKFPNFLQVDVEFDIVTVQNQLVKDETVWKYYVADESIYGIKLTKNDIKVYQLALIQTVKPLFVEFIQNLKRPNSTLNSQINQINKILFIDDLNLEKTAIIPDNFLNYIPFEFLMFKKLSKVPKLTYYYSLPMFLRSKRQNSFQNDNKLISFAPNYSGISSVTNQKLQDLPFAKKEAKEISKLFNGTFLVDEFASKENFLTSKSDYFIYHFAMHSFLFENEFSKSHLLFSKGEPLYFSELYNFYMPAEMVVLSACDTGNGAMVNGEGIMSLARAFAYTGVKSSVVSLWQIPDKETHEIMISFYKNLKKGCAKDVALANAKQEFIDKNPLKAHPYFWAGFVLNGNNYAIVSEPFYTKTYFILAAVALLIGLIFVVRKFYFKSFNN